MQHATHVQSLFHSLIPVSTSGQAWHAEVIKGCITHQASGAHSMD